MPGQLWLALALPEGGVVVELPVEPLEVDPPEVDPLEVDPLAARTLVVWPLVEDADVVVAVAAETPRPRLSPRALAAMPAARKGCLSFMGMILLTGGPVGPPPSSRTAPPLGLLGATCRCP
jgi:hypothetical protein